MAQTATHKVAKKALFIGIHRAHNPGDLVPVGNVKKHGWGRDVVGVDTQEGRKLRGVSAEDVEPDAHDGAPDPQGLGG